MVDHDDPTKEGEVPSAAEPAAPSATHFPPVVVDGGRRQPPLTESTRDTIAEQSLMGMPPSEIATLHGQPVARISALLRTDDLKKRMADKRAHLLEGASRVMFKFLLHAEQLAQDQVDDARNRENRNHYAARTWILERVAPARSTSHSTVDVNHHVHHEVLVGLKQALDDTNLVLAGRPNGSGVVLLDGHSAMPPADYDLGDETQ